MNRFLRHGGKLAFGNIRITRIPNPPKYYMNRMRYFGSTSNSGNETNKKGNGVDDDEIKARSGVVNDEIIDYSGDDENDYQEGDIYECVDGAQFKAVLDERTGEEVMTQTQKFYSNSDEMQRTLTSN